MLTKGFGIAFFCELLAGIPLTEAGPFSPITHATAALSTTWLTILIDPQHLVDNRWLQQEIDALSNYARSSPQAADADDVIMLAGDPERRACEERTKNGIPDG